MLGIVIGSPGMVAGLANRLRAYLPTVPAGTLANASLVRRANDLPGAFGIGDDGYGALSIDELAEKQGGYWL